LTDEAEKARDYLLKLPSRMLRIAERIKIPQDANRFKWVEPNGII
jgi:acyl-[acyl-carrier-protein] desaturase